MGQREEYLSSNANWYEGFSREERLQRWPSSASFGLALSGKAARAIAAIDEVVTVAEDAREMVYYQAVYALLSENRSVREIAEQLQLSKSRVGRMARELSKKDGHIHNLGFMALRGKNVATRDLVLSAWGMADENALTQDHPRGTPEPSPTQRTNLGGLNGD